MCPNLNQYSILMQMYASRSCKEWIHFPCAFQIHSWIPFISPPPLRLFVSVEANSFNYSFNINVHYIWWSIFDRIRPIAIGKTKTVASRNPAKYPSAAVTQSTSNVSQISTLLFVIYCMDHTCKPYDCNIRVFVYECESNPKSNFEYSQFFFFASTTHYAEET